MNLLEILEENDEVILAEAVRINNGKEAYELIKNNKIGVKVDPSYKFGNDENKASELITYMDKLIKNVSLKDAAFAVQMAVNKVPMNLLPDSISSIIPGLVKYKNRPWAKNVEGYSEIINLSSKNKIDLPKWKNIIKGLEEEEQNHGHGNKDDVEEAYKDGTWTMYIPHTWRGAKSVSFYGKGGEKQEPTEWCTRANKKYYDMYSKNSNLYIIRNWVTGKSYQVAFDKINVYFLDQNDVQGDEITKGDLSSLPDELLKKIEWNGRTLLDFKKEGSRTDPRKGELINPTSDFMNAKWEAPKNEGNGIVSQVMHNLYNDEGKDKFTTFMIDGKSFKFNKRNNYAKRYYYKKDPGYILITVLSNNGRIRDDILWAFDVHNGRFNHLDYNEFNKLVGDNGYLLKKVSDEKNLADNKRKERALRNNSSEKDKKFINNMAVLLSKYIKNQYVEDGILEKSNGLNVSTAHRNKDVGKGEEFFGNFVPYIIRLEIYKYDGNYYSNEKVATIDFIIDNLKCRISSVSGIDKSDKELMSILERSTNEALKKYYKEAVKDKYGLSKRIEFRQKSKGIATYDIDKAKKLQFEDYFPY